MNGTAVQDPSADAKVPGETIGTYQITEAAIEAIKRRRKGEKGKRVEGAK